ncbi:MAG: MarR family winged helix-turn-helix transcriptional regulator [Archangium sp.]|nr:MarR family winged helix-turn-helix transcriptional regulator [Archangium sp.]MDP3153556.1 MarR family winged helix-turn-helix transcriptional regulator [Archangium sp.]MDP3574521.1 MarR family winged helix-turn-helix transcriptional regulator [Archangium sp.]
MSDPHAMTFGMGSWLAMMQALTAMSLVTRGWARDLDLDECGVMVLMLLAQRGHDPECNLALRSGRARQQVHRSLRMMQQRGLVAPSVTSVRGRAQAWTLTERGWRMWGLLERSVVAWEEEMARWLEVPELTRMLQKLVMTAVNRPGGDGWRRGLMVPHDLRVDPVRARAEMEEGLLEPAPQPVSDVPLEAAPHESTGINVFLDADDLCVLRDLERRERIERERASQPSLCKQSL